MKHDRFATRRAEFLDELGDTIAIVPAGSLQVRNDDVEHAFRQDSDFFFLTGFPEPDAVAVLDPLSGNGPYTLFVRPRDPDAEAWTGRRAGTTGAVERYGADTAHTLDEFEGWLRQRLPDRTSVGLALGGRIDAEVLRVLGAVRSHADRSGSGYPARILDIRSLLHEMRLVKSEDEIADLREACRISAVAHAEAMRFTKPTMTERQVQAAVEYVFSSLGSERVGYGSIVAGGDNACILHYVENDQPLADGDLLLLDAGAEYRHLTADITRTFPVNGVFTAPQRALYEVVLEAEQTVIEMCAPGLEYGAMHDRAIEVLTGGLIDLGLLPGSPEEAIAKGWYRQFYFHGTGHWLGIDVHDAGAYKQEGKRRALVPGMAFTVEPGLYIAPEKPQVDLSHAAYDPDEVLVLTHELGAGGARAELAKRREDAGSVAFDVPTDFLGLGVRIEDDILITDDGHENLTSLVPVDPDEVEALCAEESRLPAF